MWGRVLLGLGSLWVPPDPWSQERVEKSVDHPSVWKLKVLTPHLRACRLLQSRAEGRALRPRKLLEEVLQELPRVLLPPGAELRVVLTDEHAEHASGRGRSAAAAGAGRAEGRQALTPRTGATQLPDRASDQDGLRHATDGVARGGRRDASGPLLCKPSRVPPPPRFRPPLL